jgi:hypothetical protein
MILESRLDDHFRVKKFLIPDPGKGEAAILACFDAIVLCDVGRHRRSDARIPEILPSKSTLIADRKRTLIKHHLSRQMIRSDAVSRCPDFSAFRGRVITCEPQRRGI